MCIIDCLSTIVFILPLHLDYTKVIILILWWRNFQLEYWRTFQLVSTALWKAEDIAKAISAQTDATHQSNVWITLANKNKLKIEITKEGNWKVERNE